MSTNSERSASSAGAVAGQQKRKRIVPPEERFMSLFHEFFDVVKQKVKERSPNASLSDLKTALNLVSAMDDEDIVIEFVNRCWGQWEAIRTKPQEELTKNGLQIGGKRTSKIVNQYFAIIVKNTNGTIADDLEELWEILQSMVRCSIHFLNENSKFKPKDLESLETLAERWQIKLGTIVEITDDEEDDSEDDNNGIDSDQDDSDDSA